MTMIERVAASIVIAQKRGLDRNGVARAVFEAIREPDLLMQNAGWREIGAQGFSTEDTEVAPIWRAMIDQALKDEA